MCTMCAGQGRRANRPVGNSRSPPSISTVRLASASSIWDERVPIPLQLQQLIRTLSYHSGTRRVCVELRDGSRFDYVLPVPVRPGVPAREGKRLSRARLPRISRLLALALRFERLVDEGVVRNYRELAEVGHVSRPRLSQIMQLTQLAPEIQEQVLFLPPTLEGPDRMFERQVRLIARVVDWEKQKELFRAFQDARDKGGA